MPNQPSLRVLLLRCADSACALPLAGLDEVMRPLPLEPAPRAPAFVLGVSMIRGALTPVVDLALLVTGTREPLVRRFVTLSVDSRRVAIAVSDVLGVRDLARRTFSELPPLLGEELSPLVQALASLDSRLLRVLRDTRSVGRELLQLIAKEERPA